MDARETFILDVAVLVDHSIAMNGAALNADFDRARDCALAIMRAARSAGHTGVIEAISEVLDRFGPLGTIPRRGYGMGMLHLAHQLDEIAFPPGE